MSAAEDNRPEVSSSWGIGCRERDCIEKLELECTTAVQLTDEDAYYKLCPALNGAAVFLGWRLFGGFWWCPMHVVAKNLACSRCLSSCPDCSCMGGPRADAVEGSPFCQ